jgi:hypothetical protein
MFKREKPFRPTANGHFEEEILMLQTLELSSKLIVEQADEE